MSHNDHKVHKYLRIKTKTKAERVIFRCVLPGCTHYITEEFIIGRESQCWRCDDGIVVITGRMKYRTRPYCEKHVKGKEKKEAVAPSNVVDDLLKSVLK